MPTTPAATPATPFAVDYYAAATQRELAAFREAGAVGILRYLCPLPNRKAIDRAEYDQARAAGLSVGLVWEASADGPLGGAGLGAQHGRQARDQAAALGVDPTRPIFVAYDRDFGPAAAATLLAYQRAFAAGRAGAVGAYGSGYVLDLLRSHSLASHFWQTNARGWHANRADYPHACLRQQLPSNLGTKQVDRNVICRDDWGQTDYRPPATEDEPMTPEDLKAVRAIVRDELRDAFAMTDPATGDREDGALLLGIGRVVRFVDDFKARIDALLKRSNL